MKTSRKCFVISEAGRQKLITEYQKAPKRVRFIKKIKH
jgi:hypothetical protein